MSINTGTTTVSPAAACKSVGRLKVGSGPLSVFENPAGGVGICDC